MTTLEAEPRASTPVPAGRGRWRITAHRRVFGPAGYTYGTPLPTWQQTIISELDSAHSRRLTKAFGGTAEFVFALDGRAPDAATVQEFASEVYAWRWSTQLGRDVCMFRGIIQQSEDTVTPERHEVTFTCHDYLSMLGRRIYTQNTPWQPSNMEQDTVISWSLFFANFAQSIGGTTLFPASTLPLAHWNVAPDGTSRGASGQLRTRAIFGNTSWLDVIDAMSKVIGGFDYDVLPEPEAGRQGFTAGLDALRNFYPYQGTDRSGTLAFVYGSNVASVQRTVTSVDYANYVRLLGNNANSDPNAAQLSSDAWTTDATTSQPTVGLWQLAVNEGDVSLAGTMAERAQGELAIASQPAPAYTLGLMPDAYTYGNPSIGDNVPLVVQSGRLNISTLLRVLGIQYDVGDDGQETVSLTVGRPQPRLRTAFHRITRDINALTRR